MHNMNKNSSTLFAVSVNEVDVDAFRAAVQPEFDRMVKEDGVTPTFYEQAQAILAEYRQANK